jgi:hypothetical protein
LSLVRKQRSTRTKEKNKVDSPASSGAAEGSDEESEYIASSASEEEEEGNYYDRGHSGKDEHTEELERDRRQAIHHEFCQDSKPSKVSITCSLTL